MRRRFFVEAFSGNAAVMQGDAAHHLGRVLRAQPGQIYELSDGHRVRLGRVEKITRDRIDFALLDEIASAEPTLEITLLLSIVKFEAFEWALEKATELGVNSVVPLAAARSEKALVVAAGKRAIRWQKILLESSQQSRRVRVPALQTVSKPAEAFRQSDAVLKVLLSERADAPPLRHVISDALPNRDAARSAPMATAGYAVAIAIGPEGGWTDEELLAARGTGFAEASLGTLILRAETAVVAALASINYALAE